MREVIELRVHGVGGGSPEGLLGVPVSETVRVVGEGPTGFYARRSRRNVEGYWWGRLTSDALLQPLWLFLLPFTMLNVAGWMHQPLENRRHATPLWWTGRVLLWVLSAGLTAIYAAWSGVIVVDLLLIQWRLGGRLSLMAALAVGAVGSVISIATVFWVARSAQVRFEDVPPPKPVLLKAEQEESERTAEAASTAQNPAMARAETFGGERDLARPSFWSHPNDAKAFLFAHCVVALAVLLIPLAPAIARRSELNVMGPQAALVYGPVVLWLLRLELIGLGLLLVVSFLERAVFRRAKTQSPDAFARTYPSRFRYCGQAVTATVGVALAVGSFTGIELIMRNRLPVRTGPELALNVAFGGGALTLGAAVLGWVAFHLYAARRLRPKLDDPEQFGPPTHNVLGWPPEGVSAGMRKRVARARAFSQGVRNLDVVLSIPAIAFLVLGLLSVFERPVVTMRTLVIAQIGAWITLTGVLSTLGFLWREGRRTAGRRQVGMLWDVLTFWPRRIHPWAIRPYAERAVPELQKRMYRHLRADRAVILSAHSQGTVIAVAALAQLAAIDDTPLHRVSLITYGSPIAQLYQRFFPAYFHEQLTTGLRSNLFGDEELPAAGWRNFYRETDYIGKRLFRGEESRVVDRVIDDPAQEPVIDNLPLTAGVGSYPDPGREAFSTLALHSNYNAEGEIKRWLAAVRARLARPQELALGFGHDDPQNQVHELTQTHEREDDEADPDERHADAEAIGQAGADAREQLSLPGSDEGRHRGTSMKSVRSSGRSPLP